MTYVTLRTPGARVSYRRLARGLDERGVAQESGGGEWRLHDMRRVTLKLAPVETHSRVSLSVGYERPSGLISRSLALRGAETLTSVLEASS